MDSECAFVFCFLNAKVQTVVLDLYTDFHFLLKEIKNSSFADRTHHFSQTCDRRRCSNCRNIIKLMFSQVIAPKGLSKCGI